MLYTHPRLGSQHSSSRSSSTRWPSPESSNELQPLSTRDGASDQRRMNARDAFAPLRQPGRVADRIRAINSLQQLPSNVPKPITKPAPPPNPRVTHPNDDFQRASPFPRRDSAQSPVRPETPLSQSHPLMSPLVHCPMPKRFQPQLPAAIEKGAIPDSFGQLICYRHGRKLKPRKSAPAGMDKVFSGAYVPTGPLIRQQVDPLSPWSVGERLAKTSGTTVSPDICPDCLAEHDIMKREEAANTVIPTTKPEQPVLSSSSSTLTERGTPPNPVQPQNVLVGTTIDNQAVKIPGATVSDIPSSKFGGIVATDLGDMIDAIIVEHSGTLGKVISNIRNGMPDAEWTQNLSRDLAKVSKAVAALPEDDIKHAPAFTRNISGRRSIILDTSPESLKKRAKTMPDLLDLIDAATEQFRSTSPGRAKKEYTLELPHIPGDFPHTPAIVQPTTIGSRPSHPSTIPTPSARSDESISPFLSSPAVESSPRHEPSSGSYQVNGTTPITTPNIVVESPPDEDEATLVEAEASTTSTNTSVPREQDPLQGTFSEAAPTQPRSRIPKAITIPLTKPLNVLSDKLRPSPARPKPSEVSKQQKQQRTFQQGWLRDAAVAERAERRTRSRSAHRV